MKRSHVFLFNLTKRLCVGPEGNVQFISKAAGSYADVQKMNKYSRVHPSKHFVDSQTGELKPRKSAPVDAEGAWNYIMENGLAPVPEAKQSYRNPTTGEIGGYAALPEPTRYGDWEKKGICYDF